LTGKGGPNAQCSGNSVQFGPPTHRKKPRRSGYFGDLRSRPKQTVTQPGCIPTRIRFSFRPLRRKKPRQVAGLSLLALHFQRDLPPTVVPSRERHEGNGLSIGGKPPKKRRADPLVSMSDGRPKPHEKAPPVERGSVRYRVVINWACPSGIESKVANPPTQHRAADLVAQRRGGSVCPLEPLKKTVKPHT
jgi:hypothetical protein